MLVAPVSFFEHPGAMVLNPVMRYPDSVWTRWVCIASGNPDITSAIPTMIARSPYVSGARRWTGMFHNDRRRPNTDNDLRKRWRSSKSTSKNSEDCEFLHGLENLHLDVWQNIFCSASFWFYEVERKRRKIVALDSQVKKTRETKKGCPCSQKCAEGISKSSGTIRAMNRRDVDDRMQ